MNITETTKAFAYITRFEPRREVGDSTILAWQEILQNTDLPDAMTAIRDYYSTETYPIMPAHILDRVARIRADRARSDKLARTIALNTISGSSNEVYGELAHNADTAELIAIGHELQAGPIADRLRDAMDRLRGDAERAVVVRKRAMFRAIESMKTSARSAPDEAVGAGVGRADGVSA